MDSTVPAPTDEDESMYAYLVSRNVGDEVIQRMRSELIGVNVVQLLTDADLASYIVQKGLRVELRNFIATLARPSSSESQRKNNLLDTLRARIAESRSKRTGLARHLKVSSSSTIPSASAASPSIQKFKPVAITFGWLHYSPCRNKYQTVKLKNGGGSRQISVVKTLKIEELIEEVKKTYFPNGRFPFGEKSEFVFGIFDYKGDPIDSASTVEELQASWKLLRMKMYLTSKKRDQDFTSGTNDYAFESDEDDFLPDLTSSRIDSTTKATTVSTCMSNLQAISSPLSGAVDRNSDDVSLPDLKSISTASTRSPSCEDKRLYAAQAAERRRMSLDSSSNSIAASISYVDNAASHNTSTTSSVSYVDNAASHSTSTTSSVSYVDNAASHSTSTTSSVSYVDNAASHSTSTTSSVSYVDNAASHSTSTTSSVSYVDNAASHSTSTTSSVSYVDNAASHSTSTTSSVSYVDNAASHSTSTTSSVSYVDNAASHSTSTTSSVSYVDNAASHSTSTTSSVSYVDNAASHSTSATSSASYVDNAASHSTSTTSSVSYVDNAASHSTSTTSSVSYVDNAASHSTSTTSSVSYVDNAASHSTSATSSASYVDNAASHSTSATSSASYMDNAASHSTAASMSYMDNADNVGAMNLEVYSDESFLSILRRLHSAVDIDARKNVINVDRDNILEGAYIGFELQKFNPKAQLSVRFSGEDGVDSGGLCREFLRLALHAIRSSSIFEGPQNACFLTLDQKAMKSRAYEKAGKIMAYSIVHKGPLPNFLNSEMYVALSEGMHFAKTTIDDVADNNVRQSLIKLSDSVDQEEFEEMLLPLQETIMVSGCSSLALNIRDKSLLIKSLIQFLVFERSKVAMEQLQQGLSVLGVANAIERYPGALKEAFVNMYITLDATIMEALFKINLWSLEGSNRYRKEKTTLTHWCNFLLSLEGSDIVCLDDGQLTQLLVFATGADSIPPLGFEPMPSLTFGHAEDLAAFSCWDYPKANTCSNTLRIPVLPSYDAFKSNMLAAISMCSTFTDL